MLPATSTRFEPQLHTTVSSKARVGAGAYLEECLVLPGAIIGEGARLCRAIVDERAEVVPGTRLGAPRTPEESLDTGSLDIITRSSRHRIRDGYGSAATA